MDEYVGVLLKDIPFDKLKPGHKVKSLVTSHTGVIEELIPEGLAREDDVLILWETGRRSLTWHYWLNRVVFVSESSVKEK